MTDIRALRLALNAAIGTSFRNNLEDVKIPAGFAMQLDDALREQEPRVMTLEEIRMHEVYWAEQENVSRPWPIAMHHIRNAGLLDGPVYQDYMGDNYNTKEYGKAWRCWTARPTDEQRKAVKWDADD